MKKLGIALALLCVVAACKKTVPEVIDSDQKNTAEINKKLGKYTRKQVDDIVSAIGGAIVGYYDDEELKKIHAEHFSDTCRTFSDYYFDEGKLIFINEQNFIYNKSIKYNDEAALKNHDSESYDDKKTRLVVSSFYFYRNKLIKWSVDDLEVPANAPVFKQKESELWAQSILLIKELKEQ